MGSALQQQLFLLGSDPVKDSLLIVRGKDIVVVRVYQHHRDFDLLNPSGQLHRRKRNEGTIIDSLNRQHILVVEFLDAAKKRHGLPPGVQVRHDWYLYVRRQQLDGEGGHREH